MHFGGAQVSVWALAPHIPDERADSVADVGQWYGNIEKELGAGFLRDEAALRLVSYYRQAGLLRWYRRPYFRRHFCEPFANAARFFLRQAASGVILDLGAGYGTQAIYFALLGRPVVAVDVDGKALAVLEYRKAWYETVIGRRLDISIVKGDVFQLDLSVAAPIAGVYSMFAFNMMQPSSVLLDRIAPHLCKGARLAVQDGNSASHVSRWFRSRVRTTWTPAEFRDELEWRGFSVRSHEPGVVLPPAVWRAVPYAVGRRVDGWLGRSGWGAPISHQILAEYGS
jgi:SAM-dependent methyltransferase